MDSAVAVILFSVLTFWIFTEHSVVGKFCSVIHPTYIFRLVPVPYHPNYFPSPWLPPPFPQNGIVPYERNNVIYDKKEDETKISFRNIIGDDEPIDNILSSQESEYYPPGYEYANRGYPQYPYNMYWPQPDFNEFLRNHYLPQSPYNAWTEPETVPRRVTSSEEQDNVKNTPAPLMSEEDRINNHPNWKYIDREQCGESLTDRIIGGTEATLGQYPWLALIGFKNKSNAQAEALFSCGAALINPCWVISAAHCVTNLPDDFYVATIRLGEHNLDTNRDCVGSICAPPHQEYAIVRIIQNEIFNTPKLKNDVSLIKLERPARISQWVQPICLPYGRLLSVNLINKVGEVAGWGIENIVTGQPSRTLKTVKLPVRENSVCQNTYKANAHIGDDQLCVGGTVGFDSCNGDSGGPFMRVDVANQTTPKYFIFGIVSFGAKKCGVKPSPGVYTKVAKFMDWILEHITAC